MSMRFGFRRLMAWRPFLRFRAASDGNVAVIFALTALPLLAFTGAAIDYGMALRLEVKLQAATDATALALCKTDLATTTVALQTQAGVFMGGYMGVNNRLQVDTIAVTSNPRKILLTTHATLNALFSAIVGQPLISVSASSQCGTPTPKTFEIALVLDNTGSMNESSGATSKISALRTAASNFVDYVQTNKAFASNSRMSIVPFAANVAMNPATYAAATWADTGGLSTYHWNNVDKAKARAAGFASRFSIFAALKQVNSNWGWAGCFESLPYPLDTQDGAPTSNDSLYVPFLAPDEPGNKAGSFRNASNVSIPTNNSYIDDATSASDCATTTDFMTAENRACKYSAPSNPSTSTSVGPNLNCGSKQLQRLTSDGPTLKTLINSLAAAGSTNIHEGLIWGWRTLSPISVFADGAAYSASTTSKVLILMTDGFNNWPTQSSPNKSEYFPGGYLANADGSSVTAILPSTYSNATTSTQLRNGLDQITAETCTNAKATGISIYTIGFSIPSDPIDTQGLSLLKTCASSSSQFYVANDSNGLISAFDQIAKSIGSLRITQ